MSGEGQDPVLTDGEIEELSSDDRRLLEMLRNPDISLILIHYTRCRAKSPETARLCNCTPWILRKIGARA